MEFLRNFIKRGYLESIGKLDTYKIILGATTYFDKGILKEEDLVEINEAIVAYEQKSVEEPVEEIIDENEYEYEYEDQDYNEE